MLCGLFSLFISLSSCGGGEPANEPTPTPEPTPTHAPSRLYNHGEPTAKERRAMSTDGKSMWEWQWERMTGRTFERTPMTDEEIEEHFPENEQAGGDVEGRFIFIPNRP